MEMIKGSVLYEIIGTCIIRNYLDPTNKHFTRQFPIVIFHFRNSKQVELMQRGYGQQVPITLRTSR